MLILLLIHVLVVDDTIVAHDVSHTYRLVFLVFTEMDSSSRGNARGGCEHRAPVLYQVLTRVLLYFFLRFFLFEGTDGGILLLFVLTVVLLGLGLRLDVIQLFNRYTNSDSLF